MAQNPFTPTFGVTPPMLVGRDEEISTFADAPDDGPGAPGRAMLFTGARGSGKTVMLNAVEDAAARRGWLVISETTRPGVADELTKTVLPGLLSEHHPGAVQSHVTGANASAAGFGGGVTRQRVERFPMEPSLRSEVEALTDALRPHQTGVLISLDEVHTAALQDLRQITQAVQHAFREGRELAFVAAGLPSAVQDVLNDEVMTFLRRAERFTLGAVSVDDVKQALLRPIEDSGRTITPLHSGSPPRARRGTRSWSSSSAIRSGTSTVAAARSPKNMRAWASRRLPGASPDWCTSRPWWDCPPSTGTSWLRWPSMTARAECPRSPIASAPTPTTSASTVCG